MVHQKFITPRAADDNNDDDGSYYDDENGSSRRRGRVLSLPHSITLDPAEALHGFSYTTVNIVHLQMHLGFRSSFKK